METIHLTIPNMKSAHCQMTVTNTIKSIAPAQAEIALGNGLTKEAVVQAIQKAGYKASV